MSKIIASLDIGSSKICVVIGRQSQYDGNKLEVLGKGEAISDGVSRGVIVNIDKTALSIKQALQAAEEDSGINVNVVHVNISGRHVTSTAHYGSITRDSIEQEITVTDIHTLTHDMHRMVMPLGMEIIHTIPQEYTIDYEMATQDPVGMTGVKLEANFHVITAKTHVIQSIHKCIKKAGIAAEFTMASALATSLAVLSDEEKEAGVCLVDIGASITNIVLFFDSIVRYTATIPLGGNHITADVQQSFMILERQAELLKTKFGNITAEAFDTQAIVTIPGLRNRSPKEVLTTNLAKVIQARMEEIATFIQEEILRSGFYEKLIAGMVITGGGANLKGAQGLFKAITGLDVRLGVADEYLEEGSGKKLKDPMYATAIGLALAGFKALDYREAYYKTKESTYWDHSRQNKKQPKKGSFSFKQIINKTKAFLADDYEET
ncbi:MAG: cell division protein FtsA [Candidatus Cardinium sp.]|nr:cell division protein FtsA [Candidatus Cardinium sp.]